MRPKYIIIAIVILAILFAPADSAGVLHSVATFLGGLRSSFHLH